MPILLQSRLGEAVKIEGIMEEPLTEEQREERVNQWWEKRTEEQIQSGKVPETHMKEILENKHMYTTIWKLQLAKDPQWMPLSLLKEEEI